ncbi:MAG TPA: GIY-YIG nuclease family protein [Candidatus Paceibacterota bacterium]
MYYVYILKDRSKNTLYIGYSSDLKRRMVEHKNKKPVLVYYEAYASEQDARAREVKLKQHGQTVRRLKERIRNSLA